jgi:hypothetical protein
MEFHTDKLPGEPITIWQFDETWDWSHTEKSNDRLRQFWSSEPEPCYHIVRVMVGGTLDDYLAGFNAVAYGPTPLFKHPNLKMVIFISTDPVLQEAVNGIQDPDGVFEKLSIPLLYMPSYEEALAFIRQQRGK